MDPLVYEKVKRLTCEELDVKEEDVFPEARFFKDLGASLDIVELFLLCEEEFGVEIPDQDTFQLATVGTLAAYITRKLGMPATNSGNSHFVQYPRRRSPR